MLASLLATKTVIFLMGPTASGKTDLAIALSQNLPISIISVDSALIYKTMDIGTAKPDKQTLKDYPHQLIDVCLPSESYSAQRFSSDAKIAIEQAFLESKVPVLVGGSSFYFRTLECGLSPLPDSEPAVRAKLELQVNDHGLASLFTQLKAIDPIAANNLDSNDKQRIMRALEVYQISGKTLSQLQALPKIGALEYPIIKVALIPDRALLHQRIERRFLQMLEQGFLTEMQTLYQNPDLNQKLTSMRCVGYRQAWQYLSGELDYEQMIEKAIIATRQLCKRQTTWLRSEKNINTLTEPDIKQLLTFLR